MYKKIALLLPLAVLGACANVVDGQIQDIKFVTPGATNAKCDVYADGVRHRVSPPQSLSISKSKKDLVVDCKAPGNRRKVVYIASDIETSTAWNAANAGVGAVWDYASASMFKYPDIIEVNFTDTPVQPEPPPAQNAPDIKQPEEYDNEEFLPGAPRLNEDKYAPPVEILRRQGASQSMSGGARYNDDVNAFSEPSYSGGGKADAMDYSAPDSGNDSTMGPSQPIPLIPGE